MDRTGFALLVDETGVGERAAVTNVEPSMAGFDPIDDVRELNRVASDAGCFASAVRRDATAGWPGQAGRRSSHQKQKPARVRATTRRMRRAAGDTGRVDHVWVPTTWAVLPDQAQPVLGSKRAGVMSLTFGPGLPPRPEFAEPDGIRQSTGDPDIPDPYHSH